MAASFELPELGENIDSGTVVKVLVTVGQRIEKDQVVLELETDKAVVEVPSAVAGVITELNATEGGTLHVGDVILRVDASQEAPSPEATPQETQPPEEKEATPPPQAPPQAAPVPAAAALAPAPAPEPPPEERRDAAPSRVVASPSTRRFAREIGVNIQHVPPSDASGRVTVDDVKKFSQEINMQGGAPLPSSGAPGQPLPTFERWGTVVRHEMTNIRRRTAERLSTAWQTIPHVTQFDKADTTLLDELRKGYGPRVQEAGGKLTVTAILVKVLAAALKKFPNFNASIDAARNEIIFKEYYNIGVAVDTERGLIVPVIHNVDKMNLTQIAADLSRLAERARSRKISLDEMQGGSITITNLGGIGGTDFTPIINPPEVAIIGVSRARIEPVFIDGEFRPRSIMPLALSYDHRIIDGADAARFLRWVCEALEQPFLLHLEG